MVLADFTITIESDPRRAVQVIVYDSVKRLRIAASRYDNRTRSRRRRLRGDYAHTLGVCHRFEMVEMVGDHAEQHPLCAIVRLAEPNLGVGIVSHELAHAAVWMRELTEGDDAPRLTASNDEPFCWLLGELVRQAINGMTERGVYDQP
jgi:hypothetical protein